MKIGVFATFMSPIATPAMITDFAVRAENLGLDSIWMGEHVVLFDKMEFPYPGSADGRIPVPAGGGMLDTVATFGFLAAATKRLRFGTGITLVPQRNPVYTAKEFATLDWLTGGRIDFGVGVGWCKEEVVACGYSFDDRGERCDEFLEIMRRLWTDEVASFEGKHFTLPECRLDPKPVQKPHVPMIIGGHSRAGLRRAAKFGQGWYGFQMDVAAATQMRKRLEAALAAEGRTFDGFEFVITPPMGAGPDAVKAYADAGVDHLVLHLGSQKADRITHRFSELEAVVRAAA